MFLRLRQHNTECVFFQPLMTISLGETIWNIRREPSMTHLCTATVCYIMCRGHDWLYIFLCFSIRLTRLAWKKMPGWPTSSESGTTFGSSFHSRHDDRKIGTLNSQKESTGRSGRLEIGRDAKFDGCCKLATFTWRCLIDLDWIRWLFMFLPPEGEAPTSSAGTAMSAFWNSLVGGRGERVYITISLCVPFVDCKWLQCGRELDLTCCGYDMRCRLLKWCT